MAASRSRTAMATWSISVRSTAGERSDLGESVPYGRTPMRKPLALVAAGLLAFTFVAGCGDDSGDDNASTSVDGGGAAADGSTSTTGGDDATTTTAAGDTPTGGANPD